LTTSLLRPGHLISKLRDAIKDAEQAVEKGKLELAEAEAKRAEMVKQAGTETS
jgi:hypothetical protein